MTTPKPALPVPVSVEELEQQEFKLESLSMQREVEAKFATDPSIITALKKITYYVSQVGFSIEEACTLSNVEFEKFKLLMDTEPLVKRVIRIKELEYKKGLMHTVSVRASGGDDKLAQWLLERRFPEEFANSKKGQGPTEKDILFEAIEFIQKSGDRSPLIRETSGRAVAIRVSSTNSPKPQGIGEKIKAIKEILI